MGSQGFPMTLERALKESPELKKMYRDEEEVREVIDLGQAIEGCARHVSVHAAGIVIAPEKLSHYTPLQRDPKGGKIITQYDMYSVEEVGLLKFDFLGIRNLAILANAVELVEATRGKTIDIENIPLDDAKTYEMLARGQTEATFQLNGSGMTRFLKELKATAINDINAMVALYRPGPMESIPSYIERKHNPKLITYLDPRMKDILEQSYGVITYQNDLLQRAVQLGGYSWLEVDALRKAMGKKIPAEMEAQREKLIRGAIGLGMEKGKAEALWRLIEPFAAYGFNKAHAAAYGLVAYQTAYMKANYPVEFMAAVLTAESGNIDKITEGRQECKKMDIPVLPPDINQSNTDFTIVPDPTSSHAKAIRFGLSAIKNVGEAAIDSITQARTKVGSFTSLSHLLFVVDTRRVNKKVLESLIKVGALDAFGHRSALLETIDLIRQKSAAAQKKHTTGQAGLFDTADHAKHQFQDPLPDIPELPKAELLKYEKELLGFYLTEHPMADALDSIKDQVSFKLGDLDPRLHAGLSTTVGGIITGIRTTYTKKNNQEMAFATLEDTSGKLDLVIFPRIWSQVKTKIKQDYPLIVSGKLDTRDDNLNLLVEKVRPVALATTPTASADHTIKIPRGTHKKKLQQIGKLLKSHPGDQTVDILIPNGPGGDKRLKLPYTIALTPKLKTQIAALLKL